jgi:hypothetical protein
MDLTTLVTVCALTVDPKVMHALIWHQSGSEPWAFSVPGQQKPQILQSIKDAVSAAHDTHPDDIVIRVGLAGLPSTPRSVTATTFSPCSNISAAALQIAQLAELCMTVSRAHGDPIHCAIAAYHGSWQRPDSNFADAVNTTVANDDAPDFEMPEDSDPGSSREPASYGTAPPSTAPPIRSDYVQARESPLFTIRGKSSEHPAKNSIGGGCSSGDRPEKNRPVSDRSSEQTGEGSIAPLSGGQQHAAGVFVQRSMQRFPFKSD